MKQMRSRFRLLTLLIVCAFLLTVVLCTGHILKTTGISLSSRSRPVLVSGSFSLTGKLSVPEKHT